MRIDRRTFLVVGRAVNILAPFGHISVHVEDAPSIWLLFPDSMSLVGRIVSEPCVLPELVRLVKIVRAISAGATGIFPFRLRGQAIAIGGIVTIQVRCLLVVTRLEPFKKRALVAVLLGIAPAD